MRSNNYLSILTILVTGFLVVSIISLTIQSFDIANEIKATIISGVLSMIGGALGAFGAYIVAKHQMNKEKESYEEREIINARPIISCMEFKAPTKLKNVNMNQNARLLATHFYDNNDTNPTFNFYEIKVLGKNKGIFDCKVKVVLDNKHEEHAIIEGYLGIMENNTEIFIPLPHILEKNVFISYPKTVELEFETDKNEKMRYRYNAINKSEEYFLLEGQNEMLIKEIKLSDSEWILPGRIKSPK